MKKSFQLLTISFLSVLIWACTETQLYQEVVSTYENGQAKSVIYFTDKTKQDQVRIENFYQDGSIKDEIPFINGKLEGVWVMYFPNGNKRIEGTYSDSLAHGAWRYYFETGELSAEGSAQGGNWEGVYTWYRQNGNKKKEGRYKEGLLSGPFTFYNESGEIESTTNYVEGKEVK